MLYSLDRLTPGSTATVARLTSVGGMRRRMIDLGLVEGSTVECVQKSPMGDPAAYLIRGAVIALRAEDSRCVLVTKKLVEK